VDYPNNAVFWSCQYPLRRPLREQQGKRMVRSYLGDKVEDGKPRRDDFIVASIKVGPTGNQCPVGLLDGPFGWHVVAVAGSTLASRIVFGGREKQSPPTAAASQNVFYFFVAKKCVLDSTRTPKELKHEVGWAATIPQIYWSHNAKNEISGSSARMNNQLRRVRV
jgi:hypothetical protein